MNHSLPRLTRRAFLRLGLVGGIGAGTAVIYNQTRDVGFANWFKWMVRGQAARFASASPVGIAACSNYDVDLAGALRNVWRDAGAPNLDGARVVIKPNLVDFVAGRPCFTNPRVVEELILFLRDVQQVESLVVAEGVAFRRDAEAILVETGYSEMLERLGVEFIDLNYDDVVAVPLKGGYAGLDQIFLARTIVQADALISVPKLKTHHWTTTSASIKNLFGIVPGIKYGWPKNTLHFHGIPAFLAELLDSLPTASRIALVDAVVGMQGDGPLFGSPVTVGALIAGTDFVAVDATCARLMQFDPSQIDYLAFSAWAGLGQIDSHRIALAGAPLETFQHAFESPPRVG